LLIINVEGFVYDYIGMMEILLTGIIAPVGSVPSELSDLILTDPHISRYVNTYCWLFCLID